MALYNTENIGLTKSLNKGLSISKGKYIARMDADDISDEKRFELQYSFMEKNPSIVVCGTQIEYFGDVPFLSSTSWIKQFNDDIKAYLIFSSCFAHPSVFIRNSILRSNNIKYDENYPRSQDYKLWLDLYDKGDFANLQDKLLRYRYSSTQITRSANSQQRDCAMNVRRCMVSLWLKRLGLNNLEIDNYDVFTLRRVIGNELRGLKQKYCRSLLKVYYFGVRKKKIKTLLFSLITGDFFHLSSFEKLQFLLISIGRSDGITFYKE